MRLLRALLTPALIALPATAPAWAAEAELPVTPVGLAAAPQCADGSCRVKVTSEQMLRAAEAAVAARDFAAAIPLVEALASVPEYATQQRFLDGFIAVETGNLERGAAQFRAILADNPRQTRVRLELARTLTLMGKEAAADYHYRLAEDDPDLPDEVSRTVRGVRSILRDRRPWRFSFDVGLAPDSNINSATAAETVTVNFGPIQLPLELDEQARRRSGIGQTGSYSAGLRLRTEGPLSLLVESDGRFTNYEEEFADDFYVSLAAGPEVMLGKEATVSLLATGERRWYGGRLASADHGARLGGQMLLGRGQRIGAAIDVRHSASGISDSYSGWLVGGNITYERVIARSFVASASLFARKDILESPAFANSSGGIAAGVGGELPLGLNAGLSGSFSIARYDAAQPIYSNERREDTRYSGRAYLGMRSVRLLGFSPSIDYVFTRTDSNYTLYQAERHRFSFKLARYF